MFVTFIDFSHKSTFAIFVNLTTIEILVLLSWIPASKEFLCKNSTSTMKSGQVGNTDRGIRKSIQNIKSILLTWNRRPQVVLLFLEWTFMYLYIGRRTWTTVIHCPFFLCNNQENYYRVPKDYVNSTLSQHIAKPMANSTNLSICI